MYNNYGYDDAVQDLAEEMLERIAGEIETEGMERIAATSHMNEQGSGRNNFEGASAGIGRFIKGIPPQRKVPQYTDLDSYGGGNAGQGVAGKGIGHVHRKKINANGQEKAANFYEEAEIYKQAAEEAYQEALEMEAMAIDMYNYYE